MAEYQKVGSLKLKNQGGFVVKMDFLFGDSPEKLHRLDGSRKDITLGFSETKDPGEYGVHEGDICTVYADVVAGKDKKRRSILYIRERQQKLRQVYHQRDNTG